MPYLLFLKIPSFEEENSAYNNYRAVLVPCNAILQKFVLKILWPSRIMPIPVLLPLIGLLITADPPISTSEDAGDSRLPICRVCTCDARSRAVHCMPHLTRARHIPTATGPLAGMGRVADTAEPELGRASSFCQPLAPAIAARAALYAAGAAASSGTRATLSPANRAL